MEKSFNTSSKVIALLNNGFTQKDIADKVGITRQTLSKRIVRHNWKKSEVMNKIGTMFARKFGIKFLEANFKKKDGFRKSVERSKQHGLYRQDYCGCQFSRR